MREHPYAPFIDRVQKPAQYLGGEWNMIRKHHQEVRGRVCLAFPDLYTIGMSHQWKPGKGFTRSLPSTCGNC